MSQDPAEANLEARLVSLGERLAQREAGHRQEMDQAQEKAEVLHRDVAQALSAFNRTVEAAGVTQLKVEQSEIRPDDKHLRSVQFDIRRGRHRAIVTIKSRGEVTLVGPFRTGKVEGPCKSFPFDSELEVSDALSAFLESFLEEAATP